MAIDNSQLFAIESCINGVMHKNSDVDDTNDFSIEFINNFNFGFSEDSLNCRADGKNKITLKANKAMTFQIDMETLTEEVMIMLLGGVKNDDGTVYVGATPVDSYTLTGTAKLVFADGHKAIKDIKIYNATPQISDSFNTSSLDLQTYSLTFDCAVDEKGNFMEMKDHV